MDNSQTVESYKKQPDFMLNLCQAAQVLGYKDYRKIESFIEAGYLKAYKMPQAMRKKVKYHEVMKLAKANPVISSDG